MTKLLSYKKEKLLRSNKKKLERQRWKQKRNEQRSLKADRSEALKDLLTNSQARIQMISNLSKDIIDAEITAIADRNTASTSS